MLRGGVTASGRSWVLDFCETGRHRDADEFEDSEVIFCCTKMFLRKKMFVYSVRLGYIFLY